MKRALIWLVIVTAIYAIWLLTPLDRRYSHIDKMYKASLIMEEFINLLREKRADDIDPIFDPNRTGFIGKEFTELTTTVGNLESKRTATNPDIAALICYLLIDIGVKEGDYVAVGASGSFPGLIVATLSACRSIGAKPMVICSIGSSQWGANQIDFTVLDLFCWLMEVGFEKPLLFSYGGSDNTGRDFPEELRELLKKKAEKYGFQIYEGRSFEEDVQRFYNVYMTNCGGRLAAFVNIGGSIINIGRSVDNALLSGVVKDKESVSKDGIIDLMVSEKIPVLTLLNLRKIAIKYNLPWDPIPLPETSKERIRDLLKKFVKNE
ncbi:poly-gamma-glutamate system protein [Pseudothermotoga lettingae]|uniref:Poly-gamma-glutamate system protein n=1 Tax=Pseudothermotoga lettingae (strain ATCC BAA-301 / DSM 14385 / NBRC 107922 / TMO) TaxID=416591 RepID=A8F6E5_PSELT|nr:poly-gamma-glutamate system protein [Pseudothermotoga lettingae]ABV33729.1 conserved hypothetical protein [Pseudothermotoga lettingae TMO]GLI49352.1 poly-gamma-glutamate system protein [Pseudothermotoga lettingae TMO]